MQVVWPFGVRLSYVCINDGCMALCSWKNIYESQATSFVVSMQPVLSEHSSEAFAAKMMQVASERERERKAQDTPAAGASCV